MGVRREPAASAFGSRARNRRRGEARWAGLLAVALLGAWPCGAAGQAEDDPLAPLRFLAGACWRAEIAGTGLTDVQCVEEMPGGFLRAKHVLLGSDPEYSGETIYFHDAETGHARFIYFTSLGGVSRGSVIWQDGRLLFPDQRHVSASGEELRIEGHMEQPHRDAYVAVSRRWVDGDWSEPAETLFERLPQACRAIEDVRGGCAGG